MLIQIVVSTIVKIIIFTKLLFSCKINNRILSQLIDIANIYDVFYYQLISGKMVKY